MDRVPLSPHAQSKGLNHNDLGPFSLERRDNNETNFLSDVGSDFAPDLSERKKMQNFSPLPLCDYRFCTLTEGKEWYITYYVRNPETDKLKRMRIKVNRIRSTTERRKTARLLMAGIDERLRRGWNPLLESKAPKAYQTLFAAFDVYLKIKARESEENSMRSYTSYIKTFKNWLLQNQFDERSYACTVTEDVALSFMDDMEEEVSARTYNNYIGFYRSLFYWMVSKGYVGMNPFLRIQKKPKRLTKKQRRLFTDDELSRLFSFLQADNEPYLVACLLCYCCFIRPKELALLRCRDIDLKKNLVHVAAEVAKNDNDSYRTIPDQILPFLRRMDLSRPDWYIFGQHDFSGFEPGPAKRCSRSLAKFWDLHVRPACDFGQDLQFYSLKDTGITNMLGGGVPINLVQRQADHSSVAMTAIYVGSKPEANEELRDVRIDSLKK